MTETREQRFRRPVAPACQGQWLPLQFEIVPGSSERLTVGGLLLTNGDVSTHLLPDKSLKALGASLGNGGERLPARLKLLLSGFREQAGRQCRELPELVPELYQPADPDCSTGQDDPLWGFFRGAVHRVSGKDIEEMVTIGFRATSALYPRPEFRPDESRKKPPKMSDWLLARKTRSAVIRQQKELGEYFDRPLVISAERRFTYAFVGQRAVANLKALACTEGDKSSYDNDLSRVKGLLADLRVARDTCQDRSVMMLVCGRSLDRPPAGWQEVVEEIQFFASRDELPCHFVPTPEAAGMQLLQAETGRAA